MEITSGPMPQNVKKYTPEEIEEAMASIGKHGIEAKVPILLNELERSRLEQSADTLKEILNELDLNSGESEKNENQ